MFSYWYAIPDGRKRHQSCGSEHVQSIYLQIVNDYSLRADPGGLADPQCGAYGRMSWICICEGMFMTLIS